MAIRSPLFSEPPTLVSLEPGFAKCSPLRLPRQHATSRRFADPRCSRIRQRQAPERAHRKICPRLRLDRIAIGTDRLDGGDGGFQTPGELLISVRFRRPPPQMSQSAGGSGMCSTARRTAAAVKAVKVAAPSAGEAPFDPIERKRVSVERLRRQLGEVGIAQHIGRGGSHRRGRCSRTCRPRRSPCPYVAAASRR